MTLLFCPYAIFTICIMKGDRMNDILLFIGMTLAAISLILFGGAIWFKLVCYNDRFRKYVKEEIEKLEKEDESD